MNRYQQEVAEMDRRHRIVTRWLSFAGAAALIGLALWSAGLPPSVWMKGAENWIAHLRGEVSEAGVATVQTPPISSPTVGPVDPVASVTASTALVGTDSSISTVPLPLYLLSTSPGRNLHDGTAQIGTSTANPQTYAAGALLANGALLAEIHSDFVLLKRGERTAKLSIFKQGDKSPGSAAFDDLLKVGGETHHQPVVATSREVLTDYLRPSPVYDGDVLRGYEVYPGRKAGVFSQMGLQPGDVIVALNDVPFYDREQAMAAFHQLSDGMAVVATIKRKNKSERISIDGTLIATDMERSSNARSEPVPTEHMPPI